MAEVNEGVSASNSFSELSRSNPPSESGGKSPGKSSDKDFMLEDAFTSPRMYGV